MFLVPKGVDKWRIIIDLRYINTFCEAKSMKFETLKRVRALAQRHDYMLSLDLLDGYYAVGIAEEDRDFFTVEIAGFGLFRLCGLPMGWSLSPYIFCSLMQLVVNHLRAPFLGGKSRVSKRVKRYRLRHDQRGLRMLPFVDDWGFFFASYEEALHARDYIDATLTRFGLCRNTTKGYWEPV